MIKIEKLTNTTAPIVLIFGGDPRAPTYTMYLPKPHKRARALVCDAADVIGFLAEELRVATDDGGFRERVRASSSNQRFLFVEGTPAQPLRDATKDSGACRF